MKYIDIKVSVWNRVHFSEKADMNKVATLIEYNGLNSVLDREIGFAGCTTLLETELAMTPDSNDQYSTIEVYDGDEVIWENGK